jgi:hypothetical protein
MRNKINIYISILAAFILLLAGFSANAQCNNWHVLATSDSSVCMASGSITASLSGAGAGSVNNMLYSLRSVTAGGYNVSENRDSIFQNVPAGNYRVIAKGICNAAVTADSVSITVLGNYVLPTAAVSQQRAALHSCNTGQAFVSMSNGRFPYTITITNKPAGYTGRTSFTAGSSFVIDSLLAGTYMISVSDNCGNAAPAQTINIIDLPSIAASDLYAYGVTDLHSCNQFQVGTVKLIENSSQYIYAESGLLTYSVSFDGMPKLPYKKLDQPDTITLPAGQTIANIYNKVLTYYVRTPCGEETIFTSTINNPSFFINPAYNCAIDFDAIYSVTNSPVCYPVYLTLRNKNTGISLHDTITTTNSYTLKHIQYGSYQLTVVTADGFVLNDGDWTVSVPSTTNPYSISAISFNGYNGNDGAVFFSITKAAGYFNGGTTITLVGSSKYSFSTTLSTPYNSNSYSVANPVTSLNGNSYFYPGDYVFRVTDDCGSYDLPITVTEQDVYRYTIGYTRQQTCTGLRVTPSGTAVAFNFNFPVYFKILQGPQGNVGFDNTIIAEGGTLLLPTPGLYKIGISTSEFSVEDYSIGGNGANVASVNYVYTPLAVDINRSLGWICPGKADNTGEIRAFALNGSTAATGHYTFRLAALGNGATGPYLASNTTGRFSTATSGGAYTLVKNQNYDIRVEDECGAAAVQAIKIIDFATAQLAFTDKSAYCIGETATLSVINLPSTAISFKWTGPDYFSSTSQNAILRKVKTSSEGDYNVVISSDICEQPINATVKLTLAPYILTCYSAVTDTSVNPYAFGLLGNWHATRSYTYYGARAESNPAQETDIRHDGTFADFMSFWQVQNDKWQAVKDTTRWVWNAESTLFNGKGMELENRDPLGRYNAGIYGYDDAIPVAVIQNSRFREAAYEGFEDYAFGSNTCDTTCSSDRRFDFSFYKSKIDSSQKHTGRYSLRLEKTDTIGINAVVTDTETVATAPVFNTGIDSACGLVSVLKSVNADKGMLLPSFSPLSGKKVVFSAWVKEAQDCKCSTYISNKVTLAVSRNTGNTIIVDAMPVGGIIEGWQRYEQVVELPADATGFSVVLMATGTTAVYFDDIRIHPYNANMKSFVYDAKNLRLMAELDENNYATFYEYDDDGTLTRVKKETERGIKTIKETRSALIKE